MAWLAWPMGRGEKLDEVFAWSAWCFSFSAACSDSSTVALLARLARLGGDFRPDATRSIVTATTSTASERTRDTPPECFSPSSSSLICASVRLLGFGKPLPDIDELCSKLPRSLRL